MKQAYTVFKDTLKDIDAKGLRKTERIISGPQGASIQTTERSSVLNLCANNYLGLSSDSRVIEAAKKKLRPIWVRTFLSPLHLRNTDDTQTA